MTSNKKRPSGPPLRLQAARGCKPSTPTKATPSADAAMPNIQRLLPLPTKDSDCVYALHKFDRLANRGDLADSPPKSRKRACSRENGTGGGGDDEQFFAAQAADLKRCRTAIVLVPRETDLLQPQPQQDDVRGSSAAAAATPTAAGSSTKPDASLCGQHEGRVAAAAQQRQLATPSHRVLGCSPSFPELASASPASSTISGCDEDGLLSTSCGESSNGGSSSSSGSSGRGTCCSSPDGSAGGGGSDLLLLAACGRDSVVTRSLSSSSSSTASREPSDSGSCGDGRGDGSVSGGDRVSRENVRCVARGGGCGGALSSVATSSASVPSVAADQPSACKWQGCLEVVGEAGLLRHVQETHLQRQPASRRRPSSSAHSPQQSSSSSSSSLAMQPSSLSAACDSSSAGALVSCLWLGCKVYGRESRSRAWLDGHVLLKHVPGAKPFCCIVAGCDRRFSSQALLARHVATHFDDRSPTATAAAATAAAPGAAAAAAAAATHPRTRSNCEAGGSGVATPKPKKQRKMLKGLQPCIRKTEDFVDPSMFNLMQEKLYELGDFWEQFFTPENDAVSFASEVIGQRTDAGGHRQLLLRWHPPNVLDDCWVTEEERDGRCRTRTVSVDRLRQMLNLSSDSPAAHGSRKSSLAIGAQLRCVR